MNKYLLMDAISYLDFELLAKHLEQKEKLRAKNNKRKRNIFIKWSTIAAACLVALVVAIPIILNFGEYHQGDDELFNRTNTCFETYDELTAVIGNETLLSNFDMSNIVIKEMRLKHELDNIYNYSSLSFIIELPDAEFGVGIYFPPYGDKLTDYCDGTTTKTINGILVEYVDRSEGTTDKFNYIAEFEQGDYKYVVRSSGNTNEEVFWSTLAELLGE